MTHVYWVYVRGVAFFSRRDMTHLFVRRGVYICVSWLIHMWDITHSCVRHDSFVCEAWLNYLWGWYIQLRELLDTYVRHDSFMCVRHDSFMCVRHDSFMCVRHDSFMCVRHDSFMCVRHGSFMCETWLIHVWDMTSCLTSCPRHVPAYRWVMSLHTDESCPYISHMQVEHAAKHDLNWQCRNRQSCNFEKITTFDKVVTNYDFRQSCDEKIMTKLWRIYVPMYIRIYFKITTFDKVVIFHKKVVKDYDFRQGCDVSQWEVGGWGRVPFSRNLLSPTPRRKWYLTTGRRFH